MTPPGNLQEAVGRLRTQLCAERGDEMRFFHQLPLVCLFLTFAPRHRTVCWFCQMSTLSYAGYFSFTAIKFIYIEPRDCCTVCALEPGALCPLALGCWCRCKPLPGIWTSFNSYRVIVTALVVSIGVLLPDEHWPETMSRTNRRKILYGGYGGYGSLARTHRTPCAAPLVPYPP